MLCRHHEYYLHGVDGDAAFEVDANRIAFGRGVLRDVGRYAAELGMRRVAFFIDPALRAFAYPETVRASLRAAGCDVAEYDAIRVEPTDVTFTDAAAFARDGRFDGYVSLGGGSTIDTCKAANLYAAHPAPFDDYVNAPIGHGRAVPGPLAPHIACPTTSGTGSESTGIAIFDYARHHVKTGIASRRLKPVLGVIDPDVARTLPGSVVACSGFDVLSHALESLTARPYTLRPYVAGTARPLSQGANPFSDLASFEALRIIGTAMERAVTDASDDDAREAMMYASTLAGIGFGNAGVHVPHGMAYAVAGQVRAYLPQGYQADHAMVPHGMSVIVNAPSVVRFTADAAPQRHLAAAAALGVDTSRENAADAGAILARELIRLMRACGMPNGLGGLGYGEADRAALIDGTLGQQRLLGNAPKPVGHAELSALFAGAASYW